jgi:hypothetical protein
LLQYLEKKPIEKLNLEEIIDIITSLIDAVEEFLKEKIYYFNISPENVII